MVKRLDGITQCESLGLDPHDVFSNQFLISKDVAYGLGVFDQEQIGAWTFSHGKKLIFHVLTDSRGRAFGVFIGVGVDADGEFITADSFAGFNPSARNFWSRIEDYMSGIAGRYTVFLTAQDKSRCYFDPVAHLTTLFNAKTGIVASSAFLAIDRPLQGNEKFHHRAIHGRGAPEGAEGNYILGHSVDEDVRFALPNHRLDMDSFELTRVWPMSSSFKQIDADGLEDVMQQLVLRQKQILNALVDNKPSVLPVSGGTDSRKLLACLSDRLNDLEQIFAFQHTNYALLDAAAGEYVTNLVGGSFENHSWQDAKAKFPSSREDRLREEQLFWLRTSRVAPPSPEYMRRCHWLLPKDCLHLRGNVMDLTRAIWYRRWDARKTKVDDGLKAEIGNLFMTDEPSADIVASWAEEYLSWKHSMPENAQNLVHDFIFLELFLHVSSAKYYAYPDNFYLNPFSDRRIIELTLSIPVELRFSSTVNDAFLRIADPRLADQPYRKGVKALMDAGEWLPASLKTAA